MRGNAPIAFALSLAAACSSTESSIGELHADAGPPPPDASAPALRGACGAPVYRWLPPGATGQLIASAPHDDELTVLEAKALKLLLATEGDLPLERNPHYRTLLHRIRYQTQDRGQPIEATGFVIVPEVDDPETLPVLLFLHGTTGASDACSPSANLDDSDSDEFQAALLLSLFASWGYVIVAPDYIGLKSWGEPSTQLHPYLVGEAAALASLDAVRAANQLIDSLDTELTLGPVAVWGGSQGGHAAAFTVAHAAEYAPELPLVAAVYGVPPLDMAAHWRLGLTELRASTGFFVTAFAAMAPWYGVDTLADVFVSPLDVTIPEALATQCSSDMLDDVTTLDQVFAPEILAARDQIGLDPEMTWSCIASANTLSTDRADEIARVPSLVVLGQLDTIVDPAIERAGFERLCAAGASWKFLECEGAGHTEAFLWSIDDSLDFIDARIAGQPLAGPCGTAPARECQNTP